MHYVLGVDKYELEFVAFTGTNLCSLDLSLLFIVLSGVTSMTHKEAIASSG